MKQAVNMRRFQPDEDLLAVARAKPGVIEKHDPVGANVTIYTIPPSLCSQRVRMTLREKRVPYAEHVVQSVKGENLTPAYIAINPRALMPTMTFNDRSIFDSATMMRFIENWFEGPELAPADPDAWAAMNRWLDAADDFPIRGFTYRAYLQTAQDDYWRVGMHDNIVRARELYPEHKGLYDLKLRDWADLVDWMNNPQDTREGETIAHAMADEAEKALLGRACLVGDTVSLADISTFVLFIRLQCACSVRLWGDGLRPRLNVWADMMKRRPSYDAAILAPYRDAGLPQMAGDCWLSARAA